MRVPSSTPTIPSPSRRAFSLVELLVVMAIISVLASMLLPTLANAMAQSRITACSNQERQLYLGMTFYADNNNGSIAKPDFGRTNGTWTGFHHSVANDRPVGDPLSVQRHGAWLMGGGMSTELLFCPGLTFEYNTSADVLLTQRQRLWRTSAAQQFFASGGMSGSASRGPMTPASYMFNSQIMNGVGGGSYTSPTQYPLYDMYRCTKISKLKSHFPMLADSRIMYWNPRIVHHEGSGFNILMGDGTVRWLTPSQFCAAASRIYYPLSTTFDPWKGYESLPNTDNHPVDLSGFSYPPNNPFGVPYGGFWQGAYAAIKYR